MFIFIIAGFRVSNMKCLSVIDTWKKLQHSNLVHLREVFTTKAFGDNCKPVILLDIVLLLKLLLSSFYNK